MTPQYLSEVPECFFTINQRQCYVIRNNRAGPTEPQTPNPDTIAREIAAAAREATPGPWARQGTLINGPDKGGIYIGSLLADARSHRDARYIASCSPDRVLALIEDREQLRTALLGVSFNDRPEPCYCEEWPGVGVAHPDEVDLLHTLQCEQARHALGLEGSDR